MLLTKEEGTDRTSSERVQAASVLQAAGLLTGKETNEQQMLVLLRAFDVFLERNEDRRDLWAEQDVRDALHNIRSKSLRLGRLYDDIVGLKSESDRLLLIKEKDLDEALDLINYCAFFIRLVIGWVPHA
jgi:DNA polymerase III delta prime subunit